MTKQQILQAGELTANFPADAKTIIGLELAENANGDPVARSGTARYYARMGVDRRAARVGF